MATTKTKNTNAKPSASSGQDALSLLKHDHDEVKKLFGQFEKARDAAKQRDLTRQVCMELTIHAQIEEQTFYPAVRSLPEMEDMVRESLEEHRQVKELVARIQGLRPDDPQLEPDMKVLKEDVEHHAQEEEQDMFPTVKKGLGKDRLEQLGETLMMQKQSLKREMEGQQRITEEVREPRGART